MPNKTPAALGFRMPAEWEPHHATWIAWPHNKGDWPGKFASIPWIYAEIVRHLHRGERVGILIQQRAEEIRVGRLLQRAGIDLSQIDFLVCPTDRVWTRDYGPFFIKRETSGGTELAATNWKCEPQRPEWPLYLDYMDLQLRELLTRYGAAFVSVTEQFDSGTPMGRVMMTIIAALAESVPNAVCNGEIPIRFSRRPKMLADP
jgi:hypothetical protein